MLPPSTFTVSVPLARSLDIATLGYGIGAGPPGAGVLHTLGSVAVETPSLFLWQRLSLFTEIVTAMRSTSGLRPLFQQGRPAQRSMRAAGPNQRDRTPGIGSRPGGERQREGQHA